MDLVKDANKTIQFNWCPLNKGKYNVSVGIDFNDSNPNNNKKWKIVAIEDVPDLDVLDITVIPTPVDEGKPVMIITRIPMSGMETPQTTKSSYSANKTKTTQPCISLMKKTQQP